MAHISETRRRRRTSSSCCTRCLHLKSPSSVSIRVIATASLVDQLGTRSEQTTIENKRDDDGKEDEGDGNGHHVLILHSGGLCGSVQSLAGSVARDTYRWKEGEITVD